MDPLLKAKLILARFLNLQALSKEFNNSTLRSSLNPKEAVTKMLKQCAIESVNQIMEHKELIQDEDYTMGYSSEWENYKSYWDQVLFCMTKL
jgi:hypothetical protein